jgi:hypothetical protein
VRAPLRSSVQVRGSRCSRLRESDALDVDHVLAVLPPPDGIGAAVADRLARAAS